MYFKNSKVPTGFVLFILICGKCVDGENAVANTCCPLQDTFKGFECSSVQPSSEFDTDNFHIAKWTVPQKFREGEKELQLDLIERKSSKICRESFRIQQNSSETSSVKLSNEKGNESLALFRDDASLSFKGKVYNPSDYCFDRLVESGGSIELDIVVFNHDECMKVLKISTPSQYRHNRANWINKVFAAVAGLSCLFLIVNVIIYLSLRKFLNVSGWTEFAYFISLWLFSVLSIPALLVEPTFTSEIGISCYVLSVCLQFFEITTYSSYLLIAFEVLWMLRKSANMGSYGDDTAIESKMRLVTYYFIFLSIPLGITIYGLVLNHGTFTVFADKSVPNYGGKTCFAPGWVVSEYLIYGLESFTFLLILFCVNHIFGRLSKSADVDDAPRVSLLSNMFFFTLSYWIIDLLKFARPLFNNYYEEEDKYGPAETFWTVLDGFGYAQGIIVFMVFVFNRKTLRAFRRKSGSDGTLREIFRHACCGAGQVTKPPEEDLTPMSPLMKTTSLRRSTVRRSHLY